MANKRMFSLKVVDTDDFLEMPLSSRLLYYELGMRADDDGFVDCWKKILKMTGLTEDDMKVLISKKFIIPFDSGIIVIRHWRLNNYLQRDRTTETLHKEELSQLQLKDNVYELENADDCKALEDVYSPYTECIQNVYTDKIRIDKNRLDKNREDENSFLFSLKEKINKKKSELEKDHNSFTVYVMLKNWIKEQEEFLELTEDERGKVLSEI